MYRPQVAHDIHLLEDSLEVSLPHSIRWVCDASSNPIAVVSLPEPGRQLVFTCRFTIEHFGVQNTSLPVKARAEQIPVQHTPDEWLDLQGYLRPHTEDPAGVVAAWADSFLGQGRDTRDLLERMMNTIRDEFTYLSRKSEGTQSPVETLRLGSGTCRDFAWLMIGALRRLGLVSRFVPGYLYDPALDREDAAAAGTAVVGAGATHRTIRACRSMSP